MTDVTEMTDTPAFSICIPNYNYERYVGDTIRSVLEQDGSDFEICVSDNASTDGSMGVVKANDDHRVRTSVNKRNLGFAANLDCAGGMATGRTMIMLSSDDLMLPHALETYTTVLDNLPTRPAVIGSTIRVIDGNGDRLGKVAAQPGIWAGRHLDRELSKAVGVDVYSAPASEILRSSIQRMRNPFHFATTAYPRSLYERVGGYGGQRLINPDKWFNWRLLAEAETAVFVDAELFAYRWHDSNQTAQQHATGALKFLVDEYCSTFQLGDEVLSGLGLNRDAVISAFLTNDIGLRGLREVASGDRLGARRSKHFALATYPHSARRTPTLWLLRALLALGPLGTLATRRAIEPAFRTWRQRSGAVSSLHATWNPHHPNGELTID